MPPRPRRQSSLVSPPEWILVEAIQADAAQGSPWVIDSMLIAGILPWETLRAPQGQPPRASLFEGAMAAADPQALDRVASWWHLRSASLSPHRRIQGWTLMATMAAADMAQPMAERAWHFLAATRPHGVAWPRLADEMATRLALRGDDAMTVRLLETWEQVGLVPATLVAALGGLAHHALDRWAGKTLAWLDRHGFDWSPWTTESLCELLWQRLQAQDVDAETLRRGWRAIHAAWPVNVPPDAQWAQRLATSPTDSATASLSATHRHAGLRRPRRG